jgi:hypothetical protein
MFLKCKAKIVWEMFLRPLRHIISDVCAIFRPNIQETKISIGGVLARRYKLSTILVDFWRRTNLQTRNTTTAPSIQWFFARTENRDWFCGKKIKNKNKNKKRKSSTPIHPPNRAPNPPKGMGYQAFDCRNRPKTWPLWSANPARKKIQNVAAASVSSAVKSDCP